MPWAKFGDNAATYPKLMSAGAVNGADERLLNELAGWLARCSTQSAMHMTDYRVDLGTATMIAGYSRIAPLVEVAEKVGLVTRESDGDVEYLVIVQDPDFISIRLKVEIEADRQHDKDAKNVQLMLRVRARDGDQCRYCSSMVTFTGPKLGPRRFTVEHLDPNKAGPSTADDVVVACKTCNSARRDARETFDARFPLLSAPAAPIYSKWTAEWLTENGIPTSPNIAQKDRRKRVSDSLGRAEEVLSSRRDGQLGSASSVAGSRQVGGLGGSLEEVSETSSRLVRDFQGRKSELPGSGLVGTGPGKEGTGTGLGGSGKDWQGSGAGSGLVSPQVSPRKRRRKRRGGRG